MTYYCHSCGTKILGQPAQTFINQLVENCSLNFMNRPKAMLDRNGFVSSKSPPEKTCIKYIHGIFSTIYWSAINSWKELHKEQLFHCSIYRVAKIIEYFLNFLAITVYGNWILVEKSVLSQISQVDGPN